jgi:molybdopterin/thiamine biosynthesis adenylyltransferase
VGQSAALTFAMQRLGGHFHLADFDTLSLSNMNRLRASVIDIGTNKCIVAARQIAEQDPYLKVSCYENGISSENIDNILTLNGTGKMDLIVEECDSLEMKFLVRERARYFGIPVIMETSDKGVVDIERFDLDSDLPLLHGLAGSTTFEEIKGMSREQRFEVLTKIVDYSKISEGLKQSYAALGKEVITWPQLGYEVTLGGATLAYTAGIILSGKSMKSGRIYVDLDAVFDQTD